MHIKYWMYQPEEMLIVDIPEEHIARENYISTLLIISYSTWINPEENCDNEKEIEEIYDTDCAIFIMNKLHNEYGFKLNWTVSVDAREEDADCILVGI